MNRFWTATRAAPRPAVRRTEPRYRKGTAARFALDFGFLLAGIFVMALAFNGLLRPNSIVPSGVVGMSVILSVRFGIEPALSQWALSFLILIACAPFCKREILGKTLVGSLALPFLVWATRSITPLTHEPILAAIFGGLGLGAGLGLIFRGDGSIGGFSLLAPLIHRRFGVGVGTAISLLDAFVMLGAALCLGPERALWGLIAVYATRRALDAVQSGLGFAKVAFIISEHSEEVKRAITHELQRGLTVLPARGGWSDQQREVLLVVVGPTETLRLQNLVRAIDPRAFVILSDTREVLGQGFRVEG
jgi:uncharacterized membrane-anchored protein YitT (DUF2179 family)